MAYVDEVLADNPIGYWPLDEDAGTTAAEVMGSGYTGDYEGGYTQALAGIAAGGTAVLFDGIDGAIGIAGRTEFHPSGTRSITVECWYKGTDVGTDGGNNYTLGTAIVSASISSGSKAWVVGIDASGKVRCWSDGNYVMTGPSTTAINDGQWHHVVFVIHASTYDTEVYVDGAVEATSTAGDDSGGGTPDIWIARHPRATTGGANQYLAGLIDEVAVYDSALSSGRIAAHYAAGIAAPGGGGGGDGGGETVLAPRSRASAATIQNIKLPVGRRSSGTVGGGGGGVVPGDFPINPGVVLDQDVIDAIDRTEEPWASAIATIESSGSAEATGSRGSQQFASLSYAPWNPGSSIESDSDLNGELRMFLDDSEAAYIQALLYRVGDPGDAATRLGIVNDIIDAYVSVTSFDADGTETRRLVAGWACDNLSRAISLIWSDYDGRLDTFLKDVCYASTPGSRPDAFMDWTTNPNWFASFAAARLGVAVVTQDPDLWEDAVAYFELRISQSIYHSAYDGLYVKQIDSSNSRTVSHWGGGSSHAQIASDRRAQFPAGEHMEGEDLPDGQTAEDWRDLTHIQMGLGAWCHAALTMRAQGVEPSEHVIARLAVACELHATRIFEYLNTGTEPEWFPYNGEGDDYHHGWLPALQLLGAVNVPTLADLCNHPAFHDPGTGYNHQGGEGLAFANVIAYSALILSHNPLQYWGLGDIVTPNAVSRIPIVGKNGQYFTPTASPVTLGVTGIPGANPASVPDTAMNTVAVGRGVRWADPSLYPYPAVWPSATGSFSVEWWYRGNAVGTRDDYHSTLSSFMANVGGRWSVTLDTNGKLCVWMGGTGIMGGTCYAQSGTAVNDAEWHHIALTFEAGTYHVELWIDAVLEDASDGVVGAGTSSISLGSSVVGDYDEWAIWHEILTPTKIAMHYAAGLANPPEA